MDFSIQTASSPPEWSSVGEAEAGSRESASVGSPIRRSFDPMEAFA